MTEGNEWILGAIAAVPTIWGIIRIFDHFRRKPPIELEFATKSECKACREFVEKELKELRGEHQSAVTRAEFAAFQNTIAGQIGQIRGQMDASIERIIAKLDEFRSEVQVANERRAVELHNRINGIESATARLDERTRKPSFLQGGPQ